MAHTVAEVELQHTLDRSAAALAAAARSPAASRWLLPAASSEAGTAALFAALEARAARPDFPALLAAGAARLAAEAEEADGHAAAPGPPREPPPALDALADGFWEAPACRGDALLPEATGDFVVVGRDDVVDALAAFIAAYVVALPEARGAEPAALAAAVRTALAELRKGRARRLWDWGRALYRAAAVGYGAFSAFSNPWVAQAVLAAVWAAARALGALGGVLVPW